MGIPGGDSAGGNLALATIMTIQCFGAKQHPMHTLASAIVHTIPHHPPAPWPQPRGALLISPRVSSAAQYPPHANARDMLSVRVLRASLLHIGLPVPEDVAACGMVRGLRPAAIDRALLARGGVAPTNLLELLDHPLLTPLNAPKEVLGGLPPMFVCMGTWMVRCECVRFS